MNMAKSQKIQVKETEIKVITQDETDFISLQI